MPAQYVRLPGVERTKIEQDGRRAFCGTALGPTVAAVCRAAGTVVLPAFWRTSQPAARF